MSSKRVVKIASEAVKNRTQTPLISWIRNTTLAVNRSPETPPPGLPTSDGKPEYLNPVRFPNTQASRAIEMPKLPIGVHDRLSDVYYFERDGRHNVKPPAEIYKADEDVQKFSDYDGKELSNEEVEKAIVKGPKENFGLAGLPVPGFGHEWNRDATHERVTQKYDPHLKKIERFDKFVSE